MFPTLTVIGQNNGGWCIIVKSVDFLLHSKSKNYQMYQSVRIIKLAEN